jgi:hypothetical protein
LSKATIWGGVSNVTKRTNPISSLLADSLEIWVAAVLRWKHFLGSISVLRTRRSSRQKQIAGYLTHAGTSCVPSADRGG